MGDSCADFKELSKDRKNKIKKLRKPQKEHFSEASLASATVCCAKVRTQKVAV